MSSDADTGPIRLRPLHRLADRLEREVAMWPPTDQQVRDGVRVPALAEVAAHGRTRPRNGFARQAAHDQWVGAWEKVGAPAFPHVVHGVLTLLTGGAWGLVYVAHFLCSAQMRYRRARRREMQRLGML